MKQTLVVMSVAIGLLCAAVAQAQPAQTIVVYGVGAEISGTAGFGDATVDVEVETETILENLEMAGMARYRAEWPKWSLVADGVYMGLGNSKNGVSMDVDLLIVDTTAAYRFNDRAEVLFGTRFTDLATELSAKRPISGEPIDLEESDTFLDPIVGLRFATPLSEKWALQGQGDIGGFGVGMDFQWQAMLNVGYRPSERWSLWFGYRAIDQDFDDAGDDERFSMDVTYRGPEMGVGFHF